MSGTLVKSPHLHQRSDGNIERAFTLPAVFDAGRQQLVELVRDFHRALGSISIDLAPLAFRTVVGKQAVVTANFVKGILGGRLQFEPVLAIQDQRISRPHGVGARLQPQLLAPGGFWRENRQQKQNYHILFHLEGSFSSWPRVFLARARRRSMRSSESEPISTSKCSSGTRRRLRRRASC